MLAVLRVKILNFWSFFFLGGHLFISALINDSLWLVTVQSLSSLKQNNSIHHSYIHANFQNICTNKAWKILFWGRYTQRRCRQSLVLLESAMCVLCSHRGTKRKSFCYPWAEDSCPLWSSLFPMPNSLSLPHTIRCISSDPALAEPPRPSLRWHIKATLQSRKPKTPLIHQSLCTPLLPDTAISSWRVSYNSQ